ncbi:hypothetical protein GW17_00046981 [Ensete ventricosum]|nr:hypothetical protein GW17_00046981 [Ensete ventricosum]
MGGTYRSSGYWYTDRSLAGGTTKIDCRRLIEGEIDRRRSIEGEKGNKKKRKRRKKKTSFPRAVAARGRPFSCSMRQNVSLRREKDQGGVASCYTHRNEKQHSLSLSVRQGALVTSPSKQ